MNEAALIAKHIEINPDRPSPARARLRESGVEMWAIISYWQLMGGVVERVAKDYDVSEEAVEAALAYYRRNQAMIDARIMENRAFFAR